jgi:hypothetical protein
VEDEEWPNVNQGYKNKSKNKSKNRPSLVKSSTRVIQPIVAGAG